MLLQRTCVLVVFFLLASAAPARSQGVQAGTIAGIVQSPDSRPLPGVTVTATSPELQGARVAVSDPNGVYYLRGLPAGTYRVTFAIAGFQATFRSDVPVRTGGTTDVDATLALSGIAETVTVTAAAPPAAEAPGTRSTSTKPEIDALPTGRRPLDIAELAPGLTTSAFNPAQLTLGGSFGFDNVFMVNGVDVNDNVQGTFNNLFIEEAIQETTVLTHGISAEYGRFSGGVINVVTRSGGNTFGGSVREGLSNPSWIEETPLQRQSGVSNASVLSRTHEGTFGGPIVRDRLWFFVAGRRETSNTPHTFAQGGAGYTRTDTNSRGEVKATATVAPGQTVQASYIDNATRQANMSAISAAALLDARTLIARELPNRLFALSYNGAVTSRLFATLQYSEKTQRFRGNGGTSTALADSPFLTMGATTGVPGGLIYNGPYLDATDPEQRNNRQITGSAAYLLSTPRAGTHELKAGAEHFVSTGIGGNSQSATGSVFFTDYATAHGTILRDADGAPIPRFMPGVTQVWTFMASRGAEVNIRTASVYVQDRWIATPRLTLDLGTRFETVRSQAPGGVTTVRTSSIVPRLAASYALQEGGETVLYGTYGHYSGKYGQVQFAVNTNVGRPSEVDYLYTGPAGQGREFAPGFDPANYTTPIWANFPTANVQVADDIRSPLTREYTVGIGRELGTRGHAKATYAWRSASQFVEDFIDLSRGVTEVPLVGPLTNRVYDNTDELRRDYQALIVESGYRVGSRLRVNGHYTLQLRNHGTFAGEAANRPGIPSVYGNYPEIFGPALDRLMPDGRLDNYQRHKLRAYATYSQALGRFGSVDVSPLWRVNSGAVYSLTAPVRITAQQLANNPGYPATDISGATRQTVFFGDRGAYEFDGYGVMDLATSYQLAVWKTVSPWIKLEVYNLLGNQKPIAWDRTIAADATSARDANGLPTGYVEGPNFGKATSGAHFPQPYLGQHGGRAIRIAFGARF
jgi:outer membrane receptor protein involved in Fe transport